MKMIFHLIIIDRILELIHGSGLNHAHPDLY